MKPTTLQQTNYAILGIMVSDHQRYFNESICEFALNIIDKSIIKEQLNYAQSIKNFNISSNFWGSILYKNIASFDSNENIDSYSYLCKEKINIWKNIFQKYDKSIIGDSNYVFKKINGIKKDKNYNVTINGVLALTNPHTWFNLFKKEPEIYRLNKIEKYILAEDLLEEEQQYSIHGEYKDFNSYILSNFIEHIPQFEKIINNDDTFTKKILKSNGLKYLVNTCESEEISLLFPLNGLNSIIKTANSSKTLLNNNNMLSNLMPIATPQKWIDAYTDAKEFNLVKFMNPILSFASGCNYTDLSKIITSNKPGFQKSNLKKMKNSAKEIILRLDYLNDIIKDIKLNPLDTMIWYAFVMEIENKNLFKKSLSFIDFPERNSKNTYFFEKWYDKEIKTTLNSNLLSFKWGDVIKESYKEKLDNILEEKFDKVIKPKI